MDRPHLSACYALLVVIIYLATPCYGTCTYPSDLTGLWYTSHESDAELTWTSSNVTSFTYQTTGSTYSNLVYECFLSDGTYYVSRTTTEIDIFSAPFYVFTCWVFTKMSSNKYLYRQAVTQESRVENARVKVFPTTTVILLTSEVCDDTEYEKNQFSILLRNGTAESEKTRCPSPLLATGLYTITDSSGNNYCNDNSWLDGCTDSSTLTANYTVCSDEIFYSENGVLYCMYDTSFASASGTYYTSLFNADPSPDQSSHYYFTCAVSDSTSDGVYITYYPGDCLNETYQNATYISKSEGFNVLLKTNTTCVPSSSTSNLAMILGIVFGLLFLIALIALLGYLYYTQIYLAKKRTSRSGSKVVPDTLPNTAMSQGAKNYRMMFTPAPPRSAAPGGRHKDYQDNGQFGSQTSMRPPVSQLAFYRTPTPRITDSKVDDSQPQDSSVSHIENHAGNELAENINKQSKSTDRTLPVIPTQNTTPKDDSLAASSELNDNKSSKTSTVPPANLTTIDEVPTRNTDTAPATITNDSQKSKTTITTKLGD